LSRLYTGTVVSVVAASALPALSNQEGVSAEE